MPYERTEYPRFSWSHSRRMTFQQCLRRYYYHYYGSHNGWEDNSPENVRLTYRLKKLTSLPLEIGDAVHKAAAVAIRRSRSGHSLPTVEELYSIVWQQLSTVWKQSHDRAEWEQSPSRRKMLREFYYRADNIPDRKDQIKACLRNLLRSQSFREAVTAPTIEINDDRKFDTFDIDGTDVYAIPDLVYRKDDGAWMIVDWKSGYRQDGNAEQGLVYALYLRERYEVSGEDIRVRIEHLVDGSVYYQSLTGDDLDKGVGTIRHSIAEMKTYLSDVALNVPIDKAMFPVNTSVCQGCEFYELDKDEIASMKQSLSQGE